MDGAIQLLLGSVLISIYATQRFNTPPAIRSSTTAGRYYASAFAYLMIYLASFYVFTKYPKLLQLFHIEAGNLQAQGIGSPDSKVILSALLLSVLVPRIPIISEIDNRLRRFLHRLAAIPYEAIRLSSEIQSSRYQSPPRVQDALHKELEDQGFEQGKFDPDDPIMARWISIVSLMIQLKAWKRSRRFAAFVEERNGQVERLVENYTRLARSAQNAVALSKQADDQPNMGALQDAAQKFRSSLQTQQQSLLSEICDFISHGALKTCFRCGPRHQVLRDMGFIDIESDSRLGLSVNQTVMLFGLLLALVLTNFILFRPAGADIERILLKVTMIVAIYAGAVICTVAPKQRWSFFQYRPGDYPAAGYVLSGIMAVALSTGISLAFKALIFAGSTEVNGIVAPFVKAWEQFSSDSYPWLTMAFITAVTTGFLIDWRKPAWMPAAGGRVVTGLLQGAALAAAAAMVHAWLTSLSAHAQFGGRVPELAMVLRVSAIVGFTLGYLVPHWYHATYKRQTRARTEAPMTHAGQSQPDSSVVTTLRDARH